MLAIYSFIAGVLYSIFFVGEGKVNEPGLYFPNSGGIRVEDMVLVTKNGAEVMSSLPKRLEDAVF